jgi:CHASE3 domain sensor protein
LRRKLSSTKLIIVSIGLLLIVIGIIIFASITQSAKVKDSAQMVSHTQEVLIQSGQLMRLMLENETGSRGYILTGNKNFLAPLVSSKTELPTVLAGRTQAEK